MIERVRIEVFLEQNEIVEVVDENGRQYDKRTLLHVLANPFRAVLVQLGQKRGVLGVRLVASRSVACC